MNIIKKITILLLSAAALVSCAEKEEPIVYLDVNANNIAGSWKLVEWNGAALDPDTYMYVTLSAMTGHSPSIRILTASAMSLMWRQGLTISRRMWNLEPSYAEAMTMIPVIGPIAMS